MSRHSVAPVAALLRNLHLPRSIFVPSSRTFESSRAEHFETIYKVAGQTLGDCPEWVLRAIEQAELDDTPAPGTEERRPTC
jgi:hypothetical protein